MTSLFGVGKLNVGVDTLKNINEVNIMLLFYTNHLVEANLYIKKNVSTVNGEVS